MLYNHAPLPSLEEDLREFNLLQEDAGPSTKQPQVREPDNRGGDYAGPPQGQDEPKEAGYAVSVNDKAAGWRVNVPVRPDTTSQGTAKAEDEYTDGESVEEAHGKKKLPAFLLQKKQESDDVETQNAIAEAEAAREELVSRATDVIESYYANTEQLGEDEYKAVIDAYAVLADAYDATLESVTSQLQSVMETDDNDADDNPFARYQKKSKKKKSDDDKDEDDDKDDDKDEDGDEDDAPKGKQILKMSESATPTIGRARRLMAESSNKGLGSLVNDLKNLEESLTGDSTEANAVDRHAALIEGLESMRDSCTSICQSILGVLQTEAGVAEDEAVDLDGDDDRVQLGAFFESIIEDCENHLAALAEGELDDDTAQEDLARMAADVERGVESMKTVAA